MSGWSRRFASGVTGGVDFASEEGRTFLQERVSFFAGVGFLVQCGFFVLARTALLLTAPALVSPPWTRAKLLMLAWDLTGLGLYLSAWLSLRHGRRSLGAVRAIDLALPFVTCSTATLPLSFGDAGAGAPFAVLLVITTVLMARASIVPSNPRRTLRLGIACALPLLVSTLELRVETPRLDEHDVRIPFLVAGLLWSLCAVAMSTLTSGVIYGLRRSVSVARRLGQYTLEQKLGEGGMGTVYRARHAMLRRPTAIKLLPPERAGAGNVSRFEREVQATAQLSHPNTVQIFDFGRTPDGTFYYAMEYLEGIDLDRLVREFGPQPPGRVAKILGQVAGALGEAHASGLVHRDIKPGNVILCRRGGAPDVAKVVDFGLVRDLTPAGRAKQSAFDVVTGTPLYLAPEAITAPERVDSRSDLYALGAVGYFLLAGKNPFDGATVVEVCAHHLHTAPKPPSARLGRPLPLDLEALVLACLEKDPSRRPQDTEVFVEQLEACACAAEWNEPEARAWWRRNQERVRELGLGSEQTPGLPTLAVSLAGRVAEEVP